MFISKKHYYFLVNAKKRGDIMTVKEIEKVVYRKLREMGIRNNTDYIAGKIAESVWRWIKRNYYNI